jgi:8-oxo-dGTP diphosphatase
MTIEVALLILYDSKKRFLMQQRTDDAPNDPGVWTFFGGGVEEGESVEEGLARELYEELAYEVKDPKKFKRVEDSDLGKEKMWNYFIEEISDKDKFEGDHLRLDLGEGQGLAWFTLDEIRNLKLAPNVYYVLDDLEKEF